MDRSTRYLGPAIILSLLALLLAVTIGWLLKYPFLFGPSILGGSFDFAAAMSKYGIAGFVSIFKKAVYYPPGYEGILGIFHYLVGFSKINTAVLNTLFLTMAAISLFAIGRYISGAFLGLFSALYLILFPAVFLFLRVPSREIGLIGTASLLLYCLITGNRFLNLAKILLFAFAFSLGMMIKWTFIGYVFFPIIWILGEAILEGRKEGAGNFIQGFQIRRVKNIVIASVLIFAALAPWYLGVLDIQYLLISSGNDPTPASSLFERFSYYLGAFSIYSGIPYFWIIVIALIIFSLFRKNRRAQGLVLVWFISSYLVFSLMPHREPRSLFPFIPAICLLMISGVDSIEKKWIKAIAGGLLIIASLWQLNNITYAQPRLPRETGEMIIFSEHECGNDAQEVFGKISALLSMSNIPKGETSELKIGIHPLNHSSVYFGANQFGFLCEKRRFEKTPPKMRLLGFGVEDYGLFYKELENIQILLVDDKLFAMSPKELLKDIKAWRNFETISSSDKTIPENDPGLLRAIENGFSNLGVVQANCVAPVRVYVKKSRKQGEM